MTAEEIAAKLSKSAARALLRIGRDWTDEGTPGPSRRDVYGLAWGRSGHFGLVEKQVTGVGINGTTWAYRLTLKGQQVRSILEGTSHGD